MPSPSPNSLPPHGDDPDVRAFCIVMTVVTVVSISMRFWSRAIAVQQPRTRHRFWLDDWFALAALPWILAQLGVSFAAIHEGFGRYLALLPASNLLRIAQYQFIIYFLYNAGLFFTKASALSFLRRIFPAQLSPRWFNICLWVGHGANLAWFIGIIFGTMFICNPISKNWEDSVPGYCGQTSSLFMGSSVPGVIIDLFILLLPLPRLLGLQIDLCRKIGIIVVFMFGYCVVILSLGRMITVIKSETAMSTDLPYAGVPVVYWVTAEPAISLMVVCLPAMLPMGRLIMNNYLSPLGNMVLRLFGGGSPRGSSNDEFTTSTVELHDKDSRQPIQGLTTTQDECHCDVESLRPLESRISTHCVSPYQDGHKANRQAVGAHRNSLGLSRHAIRVDNHVSITKS